VDSATLTHSPRPSCALFPYDKTHNKDATKQQTIEGNSGYRDNGNSSVPISMGETCMVFVAERQRESHFVCLCGS